MGRNEQWYVVLEQAIVDGEPCVLWLKGLDSLEITHSHCQQIIPHLHLAPKRAVFATESYNPIGKELKSISQTIASHQGSKLSNSKERIAPPKRGDPHARTISTPYIHPNPTLPSLPELADDDCKNEQHKNRDNRNRNNLIRRHPTTKISSDVNTPPSVSPHMPPVITTVKEKKRLTSLPSPSAS